MQELANGVLLDSVRGMRWPARRLTRRAHQGGHRSRRIGSSPEFMQYREYRPGDDPSKIDWKVYGRTGRVTVRETHDDSNLRTMIVVDASASMAYPQSSLAKWEMAASVAFGLSAVSQGDRDPVGLAIVGGADVQILQPRTRQSTTANILKVLEAVEPAGARPLAPVLPMLRTNNRIAILSDFLGDADAVLDAAGQLVASGREIFAVHVIAREELDPGDPGGLVVDPEDDTIRRPLDEPGIAEYRREFARWREALTASSHAAGVVYQPAVTDEPPERVIRRIVTPSAKTAATHASS